MKQLVLLYITMFLLSSCNKFLDEKPRANLRLPESTDDLQSLLDNMINFNEASALNHDAADDFYITEADWNGQTNFIFKDAYIWKADLENESDWLYQYRAVFYANSVIAAVNEIQQKNSNKDLEQYRGAALFFRALSFFNLLQLYAPAYNAHSANTQPGIALRLDADFNKKSVRSTVAESYQQILQDLEQSIPRLLPKALFKTRPGKVASYGLLARIHLAMGNFSAAMLYADSCLAIQNQLINYSTISATAANPFLRLNDEVILHTNTGSTGAADRAKAKADTNLFKLYELKDLRRTVFYGFNTNGSSFFKGSYSGATGLFGGIATDEIIITRAECRARLGDITGALKDLNDLRARRFLPVDYQPVAIQDQPTLIQFILDERRRELAFRGLRWMDLKRLNQEAPYKVTLKRKLGDREYTLTPDDLRYAILIPSEVIQFSGMEQNKR